MDALYTVKDVREYLQISQSRAYQLISTGEIPHVKIGSVLRVRGSDLAAYLESNLVKA